MASATLLLPILLTLAGCQKPQSVTLPFQLSYHNEAVDCENFPKALSLVPIKLKDFRLYLHDIELLNAKDQWQPLTLAQDSLWQHDNTALLDFENAQQGCKQGNRGVNPQITGTIDAGDYKALRFKIGVPFELNHNNPMIAAPPLNLGTMHWHWQGGYKFVRAEFLINQQPHRFHLGSLQCKGEVGAISHCEKPNRPQFTLNGFKVNQSNIKVSLDGLLDMTDYPASDKKYLTCMGGTGHPWCHNALKWLGLADSKGQSMFSINQG
ncbi:MAG: putative repeat protein (TIGR04052 family) [Phenylobacterium sp.]|jgi:uncharacterized repeat protein (TIGR04052 family)